MFWGSCLKCRSGFRHFGRDLGCFCRCILLAILFMSRQNGGILPPRPMLTGQKNLFEVFLPLFSAARRGSMPMPQSCGNYGIARTFDGGSYQMFVVLRELYHSGVERSRPAERYGNLNTSRASYECENVDGFLTSKSFERNVNVIVPCIFFHYLFLTVLSH